MDNEAYTAECRPCGTPLRYVPLVGYVSEFGYVCRVEDLAHIYYMIETESEGMHLV